jgi:hypothetical protein
MGELRGHGSYSSIACEGKVQRAPDAVTINGSDCLLSGASDRIDQVLTQLGKSLGCVSIKRRQLANVCTGGEDIASPSENDRCDIFAANALWE